MNKSDTLIASALKAQKNAYCPYSGFPVGAAVLAEGKIYAGCNVENASYGSSLCAERTAVAAAVAAGARKLQRIVVVAKFSRPCGACRQIMLEFSDAGTEIVLISQQGRGQVLKTKLHKLLPHAFNPEEAGLK